MRLPFTLDLSALPGQLRSMEDLIGASMKRIQAKTNAVSGPRFGAMGGIGGVQRSGNQLVGTLTGMGSLTTGLGIGAAVGGMALLEQGLTRSIRKAREFQTATLAIAATLGSIGSWQGGGGRPLPQAQQAQRNMWQAEKYRTQILERSAKNILTFEEQLQSFQSGLASGARKGLKPDQILKLTETTAVVAKTLGLRGEQIANASRLLMGGGVNVARSTIGRALGISNTDITTRTGTELATFLQTKMRGFDAMQSKFEGSIEGMVSTLEAKIDVLSARAGAKFMKGIAPTLKSIGLLGEPTRDQFKKGAEGTKEFGKATKDYAKQAKTMDDLVNAAAKGFNGLFKGVKAVVESDSFKILLDLLIKIAGVSKQIMLAVIFSKIAGAVGAATGALQKFLAMAGAAGAVGRGGGAMALAGTAGGGMMPANIASSVLSGGAGAALGFPAYQTGARSRLIRPGMKASTAARYARGNAAVAGPSGAAIRGGMNALNQEEAILAQQLPWLRGDAATAASARLDAIGQERAALQATEAAMPYGDLTRAGKFGRIQAKVGGYANAVAGRLPVGMMGLMGGQMIKEAGWGAPGQIGGTAVQGASLGYMLGGVKGLGIGALAGVGQGVASYSRQRSMEDINKPTTFGQYAGMALGGAAKGAAVGLAAGSVVPGLGNLVGAGVGAVAGGIMEPLNAELEKLRARAKSAAGALAEMEDKFPQYKKINDLTEQRRVAVQKLADAQIGGKNPSTSAQGPLQKEIKSLDAQIKQEKTKKNFVQEQNDAATYLAKLKESIGIYSQYGGKGPAAQTKLIDLQTKYARENLKLNKSQIPVDYDAGAVALRMKDSKNPQYKKYEANYHKWQKITGNEKKTYDEYVSELTGNVERAQQEKALPGLLNELNTQGAVARMGIASGQKAYGLESRGLKTAAGYEQFRNELTQKAPGFEGGLYGAAFKKYSATMNKEKIQDMREDFEGKVINLRRLRLQAQDVELSGTMAKLDVRKVALQGQAIADETYMAQVNLGRNAQTRRRMAQEYPLAQQEGLIGLQQAKMAQRSAANAPAMFYGGMGPVSEVAGAIRYRVEAEKASKFDSAKYEKAYREQLDMEEQNLAIGKTLADINAKRAELGLDRIEEDYANSLIDITMQQKALSRNLEELGIAKTQNTGEQKVAGRNVEKTALDKAESALALRKATRDVGENAKSLKAMGISGLPGVPTGPIPTGTVAKAKAGAIAESIPGVTALPNGKIALPGGNIVEPSHFLDLMQSGNVGAALQAVNPNMTGTKMSRLMSVGEAGKTLGYENTAIHEQYAKAGYSKEDYRRIRQLMDNGMTRATATQSVTNSNAMAAYNADKTKAEAGNTYNVPITITDVEKVDPAKLKRDFESWIKEYCAKNARSSG
jgi:hypothetical protein